MTTLRPRVPRQGTGHTDTTARAATSWDQRRYWHNGAVVRTEWWRGQHLIAKGPLALQIVSQVIQTRDFCYHHGTQIYRDLGCQTCRQRPGTARDG